MNPFDVAKDLSHKKKGDLVTEENEGQYIKESYTINVKKMLDKIKINNFY